MKGLEVRGAHIKRTIRRFVKHRKNDLIYLAALAGVYFLRLLPLSFCIRLGGGIGLLAYYVLGRHRKRALEHLSIAFSDDMSPAEKSDLAKRSFQNLGKNGAELVNFHRLKKDLNEIVTGEGRHHLDSALARGKGVIWITAHLGNWELMAFYMAQRYSLSVVAREVYDERLNKLLLGFRKDAAVQVILRDSPSAPREILKALKANNILGMLIDQDTKVKGIMADFFGLKANTPVGPATLARRGDVPVIAGFIHRLSDKRHRIVIEPVNDIVHTEDAQQDMADNTLLFNRVIERHIREHPGQWVWVHRRWRRQTAYQPVGA